MKSWMLKSLSCLLFGVVFSGPAGGEGEKSSQKQAVSSKRITLAYFNDVHAQLEPHAELYWRDGNEEFVHRAGGLSRIATVVKRLRAERPKEVLLLDGGDTFQGSGPAAWTKGSVMVEPMNALGVDVAIPGNWSVAYGPAVWKSLVSRLNYEMIAANMADDQGKLLFKPYTVREIQGVKIGFVGFTEPEIPVRQPPFMSEGLKFFQADGLQGWVDELREEKKVDLVVVMTHIGLPKAVALAERLKGVDIVLSADTHERTYEPVVRGDTWIVEAGAFGSFLGLLEIEVDATHRITQRNWRLIELRSEWLAEDAEMKAVVDRNLTPHRERMNQVIGYTQDWLSRYRVLNTSIDHVISDAIREATGADVGLSNGYRFAPPTAPGVITEADLWTWLPTELRLKTGLATGDQLHRYWSKELENVFAQDPTQLFGGWLPRVSGLTLRFNRSDAPADRIKEMLIGDLPVERDRLYSVASGDLPGAPADQVHRIAGCQSIRHSFSTVHAAIRSYLERHSPVQDADRPRVHCLDGTEVIRSQYLENHVGQVSSMSRP